MSGTATALRIPRAREAKRIRHLEVAATAAQRRARPRLVYAVIVVGGIGAILLAQLLMSIATADGAYRISALQIQARDYARQQSALGERIDVLRSTQNLTRDAEALGMVSSGDPVFLDVATGAVRGTATAAGGSLTGAGNLVGNALLSGSAISRDAATAVRDQASRPADPTVVQEDGGGIATPGAPATTGTPAGAADDPSAPGAPPGAAPVPPVPSAPGVLPSPTTR